MRKSKFLKALGFLIALIPFTSTACSYKMPVLNNPKYLLTGEQSGTDTDFVYYSINNDTEYAVALRETKLSSGGTFTIESEYNGKPVTGIWRNAFYNSKCTGVVIPNSITVIDYEAFMNSKIKTITIPASVTDIGEAAFYSSKSLTKVVIQNSTTTSESSSACSCSEDTGGGGGERTYSTLKVIPSFCFFNCVALKELVLPQSIEEIEYEAFNNCISLFSTLAFMNIKAIRSRAFQDCKALKKVYISSSFFERDTDENPIGIIEEKAFENCNSGLEFFLVGDTDDVEDWNDLARNANWNRKSEFSAPGNQILPDATGTNRYTYHITASGASYTNDWIYTVDLNGDVEIASYIGPTDIENEPVTFLTIPNELPSGSGNYVRRIALNALDSVKANLVRLYLPTTLQRIENGMFGSGYTNLIVIDDNSSAKCTDDQTKVDAEVDLTPRIILNDITDLEVIGNSAFVNMPKLGLIKTLYLPYSLKAVGAYAFGKNTVHMKSVKDFKWDYDDELSALKVIGREAFYKLGNGDSNASQGVTRGIHRDYLAADGTHNYELTTLVIPRTFEHFGITSTDNTTYNLGGSETDDSNFGISAFAGCPLLEKVVFRGSKYDAVTVSTTDDSNTFNLIIPSYTFVMEESLRTVIFEERVGKNILFYTANGTYRPCIGWSTGKASNDFSGDPGIQTIVLPNKKTNIRFQNFALQGNSRGAIYLSAGTGTGDKINGSTGTGIDTITEAIANPAAGSKGINDASVKEWRTIGDEGFYAGNYPGYCFASNATNQSTTKENYFGIDQKMPMYGSVLYQDKITDKSGAELDVIVGHGNANEFIIKDKCAFVTSGNKATMTKYLFDRHDSSFTGTAKVPATVTKTGGSTCTVNVIGASAFSAAYCDSTSYKNHNNYANLTEVLIPNTVATIDEYAFMRAYGVTKVSGYNPSTNASTDYVMPTSLTRINKHAFAFCNVEKVLNIPDSCLFYENTKTTGDYETSVFANNFALRKVTFGNSGATSSTNYTTTTYTHSGSSETYTSAIYSTAAPTYNASSLLIVLNRDSADYHVTSADFADITTTFNEASVTWGEFNGQYASKYLYGAFKMCYWIDSLVIGTAVNASINQPLISGIHKNNGTELIYLNKAYDFTPYTSNLKAVSLTAVEVGGALTLSTPPYSFEGCENLVSIKLPKAEGAFVPEGLFSFIENEDVKFIVPSNAAGTTFKECDEGELDLSYTGYAGIEANAFKSTNLTKVIAPITTDFTINQDAFGSCQNLTEFDLSNVTGTIYLNGAFRGSKIASNLFDFGSAFVEFGEETFKGCNFSDDTVNSGTFTFPVKTRVIGKSCFESSTVKKVTADGNLVNLKRVAADNASGKNNDGRDPEGLKAADGDSAGTFKQIGDYAFYLCTSLADFDFSKFNELERIGHYAFSMNDKLNNEKCILNQDQGVTPTASNIICTGGIINLPSSITNIGAGAFNASNITRVIINSSHILLEHGGEYTQYDKNADPRLFVNKGCHQFRNCPELLSVFFSNPDCTWDNPYLTKGDGGQENFFSNCGKIQYITLPTDFLLQNPKFTVNPPQDNQSKRPDSMMYMSNASMKVYLYHSAKSVNWGSSPAINDYWHRIKSGTIVPLVFYVHDNSDVVKLVGSTYSEINASSEYWTVINGEAVYLGMKNSIAADGTVTFTTGYIADSTHVYHP